VTAAATPADPVADLLRVAARQPDRCALLDGDTPVGYRELAAAVRGVLDAVAPHGDGPVGVVARHDAAAIIGALGVLAAGRSYVALDPSTPAGRLRAMIEQVGCTEIVGRLPDAAVPPSARMLAPARDGDPLTADEVVPADPESAAYLLFTSGSTGTPKAVVVPRRALSAVVPELVRCYGIEPDDRVLHFTPLFWDTSLEELLPTLSRGATLVLDPVADLDLPSVLHTHAVTVVNLPTGFWHETVTVLLEDGGTLPACTRTVVVGGEPVRPEMLRAWHRLGLPATRLVNTYGSTETALVTHAVDIAGPAAVELPDDAPVPFGRPLGHVRQAVVAPDEGSESDQEVGTGTEASPDSTGELLLSGPNVALGYHGRPELTARRFPVLDLGDGPRVWFRTGDRVGPGPAGTLVHKGRIDGQVKVRGIRVDLGEVEYLTAGHPRVRAVAVAPVARRGHTSLTAFVVLHDDGSPEADALADIRRHLRATAPAHLVPGAVLAVPELCHTRSRKIDRAATQRRYAPDGETDG
jgi:amino acid adenylation domain-containing protein